MSDHRHESYDIYNVATQGDLDRLQSQADGLREDLSRAESRIHDLEDAITGLRAAVHDGV